MNKTLFIFFTMFCFLLRRSVTCYCRRRPQTLCRLESFGAFETASGKLRREGDFGKGIEKVKANYRLTSANSRIIETFHIGMPHKMVSVYHDDKNKKLAWIFLQTVILM